MFLDRALTIFIPLFAIQCDGVTPTPLTVKPNPTGVCTCGPAKPQTPNQNRILGGQISVWHPWLALIVRGESFVKCTATLIGRIHVITAAHCINKFEVDFVLQKITVLLGAHKNSLKEFRNSQRFKIEKFFFHPEYMKDPEESKKTSLWDIAIIRLDSPANFNQGRIAPACLHQPKDGIFGHFVVVQGMGRVDRTDTKPNEVMEITDLQVNNEEIQDHLKSMVKKSNDTSAHSWVFGPEVIVATNQEKGVWSGDSGGPLLYLNQSYSLVGVTSFNWEEEGNFNGFVSVRAALPWIEDTLKEGNDFNCKPVGP